MRWHAWVSLTGAAKLWAASIVFVILGGLLALLAPAFIEPHDPDDEVALLVMRVLGGLFLALGLAVLLPMLVSLRIADPVRRDRFYWWVNFMGGLLGALSFAVPAALAFPIFLAAYVTRPNALVPDDLEAVNNLGVSAMFSLVGIVVLIALFFVGREMLRTRNDRIEFPFDREVKLRRPRSRP